MMLSTTVKQAQRATSAIFEGAAIGAALLTLPRLPGLATIAAVAGINVAPRSHTAQALYAGVSFFCFTSMLAVSGVSIPLALGLVDATYRTWRHSPRDNTPLTETPAEADGPQRQWSDLLPQNWPWQAIKKQLLPANLLGHLHPKNWPWQWDWFDGLTPIDEAEDRWTQFLLKTVLYSVMLSLPVLGVTAVSWISYKLWMPVIDFAAQSTVGFPISPLLENLWKRDAEPAPQPFFPGDRLVGGGRPAAMVANTPGPQAAVVAPAQPAAHQAAPAHPQPWVPTALAPATHAAHITNAPPIVVAGSGR